MLHEEINSYRIKRQRQELLDKARRIAVVGIRPDPIYKSYTCTKKLIEYGVDIAPVVTNCESILGLANYGRVAEIPEPVDIVQFYTDGGADMLEAAKDAVQIGAKMFWIENGAASDQVCTLLKDCGVRLVENESLQGEYENFLTEREPKAPVSFTRAARHVSDVMTRHPVTVTPRSTVQCASEKMKKGHFRHLPVVDANNRLLGMFSDRDLRLLQPSPCLEVNEDELSQIRATTVGDAAAFNPVSVLPDATLEEAAELMLQWKVEALPVIAGDSHLVGIITASDFLKERAAHVELK